MSKSSSTRTRTRTRTSRSSTSTSASTSIYNQDDRFWDEVYEVRLIDELYSSRCYSE